MAEMLAWQKFCQSGSVNDYLLYTAAKLEKEKGCGDVEVQNRRSGHKIEQCR